MGGNRAAGRNARQTARRGAIGGYRPRSCRPRRSRPAYCPPRRLSPLPATRRSLLAKLGGVGEAGGPAAAAWGEFVRDYEAGLVRFVRGRGLQDADARDVVQEVLLAVHHALTADDAGRPDFAKDGAFRAWLSRVAFHKSVDAVRRRAAAGRVGAAAGGSAARTLLEQRPDSSYHRDEDDSDGWRRWAFCVAAGRVEAELEPRTWAAFVGTAVDHRPAAAVAAELDMTAGAVYAAKCRTLAKLRAVAATLGGPGEER